jgi:hypothetical protein
MLMVGREMTSALVFATRVALPLVLLLLICPSGAAACRSTQSQEPRNGSREVSI